MKSDPNVEIIWRAFELRPEPVPLPEPHGEYLQRVWTSSVYPLAEQLGVTMRLPPVKPRSRLAHEAAEWSRAQGRFDDYHREIFRAYFERGKDIGDIDVLLTLAAELEMDSDSLRQALTTEEYLEKILADERDAEKFGLRGVPAFIANRKAALSGVQPGDNLKQLVRAARG